MQIQLNTDNRIVGSEALAARVDRTVRPALDRFVDRVTRLEVHLNDVNGARAGDDKRCMLEARVAGEEPVAVSHQAATFELAIDGAKEKLVRALDRVAGKREAARRDGAKPGALGAP